MGDASTSTPVERRLGRYELTALLGGGAMGEVFRARDGALGRDVAVKVMHRMPGVAMELFRARFDAEARALAALRHPAVVAVYDIGWDGDDPYLVMELVPGGSLRDRIEAAPLAGDAVRALGIQIGGALAAAHAAGIVHRDVKPANVLGGPGEWKLADFGIAHVPGSELTMTGQFLGTPAYAAPEALGEGALTPSADVWGLGATLYRALTGETPYTGTLGAIMTDSYVPVRARGIEAPAAVLRAIDAALDRNPARRPSASALCELLAADHAAAIVPLGAATVPLGKPAQPAGAPVVLAPSDAPVEATAALAPAPAGAAASSASWGALSTVSEGIPRDARSRARPAWMLPAIGGGLVLAIGLAALIASGGGERRGRPGEAEHGPAADLAAPAEPPVAPPPVELAPGGGATAR